MKSLALQALEATRNPLPPGHPSTSAGSLLRPLPAPGGAPDAGPTVVESPPTSSPDPVPSGPEPSSGSASVLPGRKPTRVDQEQMSSEDFRSLRLAYGLRVLRESQEYRRLLVFPATCYESQILALENLGAQRQTEVNGPGRIIDRAAMNQITGQRELLEAAESLVMAWSSHNLWAIPCEIANGQEEQYGLIWCSLPPETVPLRHSQWLTMEPVTGWPGVPVTLTMDPFPVPPDLWSRVGLGAVLTRRIFEGKPTASGDLED